jgi:multiple sugar transport system substrate-binding protein
MRFSQSVKVTLLVIFAAGIIAGCKMNTKSTGPVLVMGIPGSIRKPEMAVADAFMKKFPAVKVNPNLIPDNGYLDKLISMAATDTLPDVMWLGDFYIPPLAKKGALLNLDTLAADDKELDLKDFWEVMLDCSKVDGKLYVLPHELGGVILAYNKDMFDKAGIKYPDYKWTWKDMLDAAQKLTKDTNGDGRVDQFGIDAPPSSFHFLLYFIWNSGGRLFSPDKKTCLINSPESIRGINYALDLIKKYKVAPVPGQEFNDISGFEMGKIGMIFTIRGYVRGALEKVKFNWDVAPLPIGPLGKRYVNTGTAGWGISSKTKYPKEAWDLLKFIVSPEGQEIVVKSGMIVPVRKSMRNNAEYLKLPPKNNIVFIDGVAPFGRSQSEAMVDNQSEIWSTLVKEVENAWLDKKTTQQAMDDAKKQIDGILTKNASK